VGSFMDSDPQTVVSVMREMKAAGKGIVGMKILGQGTMRDRQDEALKFALGLGLLDAFNWRGEQSGAGGFDPADWCSGLSKGHKVQRRQIGRLEITQKQSCSWGTSGLWGN